MELVDNLLEFVRLFYKVRVLSLRNCRVGHLSDDNNELMIMIIIIIYLYCTTSEMKKNVQTNHKKKYIYIYMITEKLCENTVTN